MNIRNYTDKDFELLSSWWAKSNEPGPMRENLPEESTFVLEYEGVPVTSLSVFTTNSAICYFENFIADPEFTSSVRKECTKRIWDHAREFCRSKGYKYILFFSYKDKIKSRYEQLGARRTLDDLSSFILDLRS